MASAPLLELLAWLGERLRDTDPDVLLDTLAYAWSFEPPRSGTLPDNVVVRVSALYQRDFSKSVAAPQNAAVPAALAGWHERGARVRVWDYLGTYGPDGDLPLPNLAFLDRDLRSYRDAGVEGLFVQQDPAVGGDLRDVKLWVLTKLLEDPARDGAALSREFLAGYYGPAGSYVRRYLAALDRAVAERPARIGFAAPAADFAWLDGAFLIRAQREFDAAEQTVRHRRELLRRLRHARSALDQATLARFPGACGAPAAPCAALDLDRVHRRLRDTWYDQLRLRYSGAERRTARRAARERARELRPRPAS